MDGQHARLDQGSFGEVGGSLEQAAHTPRDAVRNAHGQTEGIEAVGHVTIEGAGETKAAAEADVDQMFDRAGGGRLRDGAALEPDVRSTETRRAGGSEAEKTATTRGQGLSGHGEAPRRGTQ